MQPLKTGVTLTTIVHFRFVEADYVFELIFYWNCYLLLISNSFTEYVKQKNLIGFSSNCTLGKRFIFVPIKMKHLHIIQFDVFHIKNSIYSLSIKNIFPRALTTVTIFSAVNISYRTLYDLFYLQ
jgi:hypothetical protein